MPCPTLRLRAPGPAALRRTGWSMPRTSSPARAALSIVRDGHLAGRLVRPLRPSIPITCHIAVPSRRARPRRRLQSMRRQVLRAWIPVHKDGSPLLPPRPPRPRPRPRRPRFPPQGGNIAYTARNLYPFETGTAAQWMTYTRCPSIATTPSRMPSRPYRRYRPSAR